jgi:hypothetical protein
MLETFNNFITILLTSFTLCSILKWIFFLLSSLTSYLNYQQSGGNELHLYTVLLQVKPLMALLFTWLIIKYKITSVSSVFHHTFLKWESCPHINYTISNIGTQIRRYFITISFVFSFYFFLKKVEMFFDPDAALARALSFAVMLGLAAYNTTHSTPYNQITSVYQHTSQTRNYTVILAQPQSRNTYRKGKKSLRYRILYILHSLLFSSCNSSRQYFHFTACVTPLCHKVHTQCTFL